MAIPPTTKNRIWRLIRLVVIVEIAYLVLFNIALQLPLTQTLINSVRPEKFQVSWENAWTWYPFRVQAVGVAANGQSRSQQWQFETPSIAASISVAPLIFKRVWINDLVAHDISYRQRPRLKPDKDYSSFLPFYPEIDGRELTSAITTPRKKKKPWRLAINSIQASGNHSYWIMQLKGTFEGEVSASLAFESQGGPFSLDNAQLDLTLDTMYINNDNEVFRRGQVKGELAFSPFVPAQNKSVKVLNFLSTDAYLEMDVNSLAFINLFTRNFNQMTIDGAGRVAGRFQLHDGHILKGTDFAVDASDLRIALLDHRIEGEGALRLVADDGPQELLNLSVEYSDLAVTHAHDDAPVLIGKQLGVDITGPNALFSEDNELNDSRSMRFLVGNLSVPDLQLLQHYLPEKWPLELYGGEGRLDGHVNISSDALDVDISLSSDEADMQLDEYRFQTNLDAALKLANPEVSSSNTNLAGSYIKLTDAGLSSDEQQDVELWRASLLITDGYLRMLKYEEGEEAEISRDLLRRVGEVEGKELLSALRGSVSFESSVSSLGWLDILLKDESNTALGGSGEISGTINLDDGLPAPGTDVVILSEDLALDILDYRSNGAGKVAIVVEEGDSSPDWQVDIALQDADLLRQNEIEPYIHDVSLHLTARVENVTREKAEREPSLRLQIESAHVSDMSIFNSYLPADAPLQLVKGTASLAADIALQREDAQGWLSLESSDVEFTVDNQSIRADLVANVVLADGIPAQMMFDISGSRLQLDNVRVAGDNQVFDEENWFASLKVLKGTTVWKKPLQLDTEMTIQMLDSRPFVAMFDNQKGRPDWLLEMLTIRDIQGRARIAVANEQIMIPLAHVTADKIEVGARGQISEQSRKGVIYARYKKLDALLKFSDGNKNIDVIRARQNYDEYQPAP